MEVANRFKGLDLIDRVPEELWMYVCDIAVIKNIHKKKKYKKVTWLSEEALQIAVKRKEAKSKGENDRHTHLNAEFQTIARRDKKAFLSDQRKGKRKTIEWERLETSSQKLEILMEKAMAPHSSTLAWKIPWTEEPGRLQSMGSLRVGHD